MERDQWLDEVTVTSMISIAVRQSECLGHGTGFFQFIVRDDKVSFCQPQTYISCIQ